MKICYHQPVIKVLMQPDQAMHAGGDNCGLQNELYTSLDRRARENVRSFADYTCKYMMITSV